MRDYVRQITPAEPPLLAELREHTARLPFVAEMQSSPELGQLLQFLIRFIGARRALEVGAFTGCSTLAMASALPPGGRVVAVEQSARWASIGRDFWVRAGCADRIDLRIGDAMAVLDSLLADGGTESFDLAFIDANKDAYVGYFERCLELVRPNGLLIFDNVLYGGNVYLADGEPRAVSGPPSVQRRHRASIDGVRRFNEIIVRDRRVDIVVLPVLDGVTLAHKVGSGRKTC